MEQLAGNLKISDFTKQPLRLFKFVGIRLIENQQDEGTVLRDKFVFFVLFFNLTIQLSFMFSLLFFDTFSSPIEMTAFACYSGFTVNCFCKLVAVWSGRSILSNVLIDMEKIFPKTYGEGTTESYYRKNELHMKILTVYHLSTTTMFSLFPIFQSVFEYNIFGGDFVYRFPFPVYYPFDETQFVVYPLMYFCHVMCAYSCSIVFLGADLLLVSMVRVICMYLELLMDKIRNFEPTGTDADLIELKGFIKYHSKILSCSVQINKLFNFAIFMNYIATCGVICLIGFQITAGSEILDLIKFIAFLISSLVHVYFICYFGTNLFNMSLDVSYAVYSHKWYLGNTKYKKMLILLMARSQKPAFLTAFKFFIISMESFKTLVTSSYQFFTLIKTKYDEDA